jgi:hypothetical protein
VGAGLVSSVEPRLGVPTFFWVGQPQPGTRTPRDMGLTAEHMARRTLFAHAELYRADKNRWADATMTMLHQLNDDGAVIATFEQRVAGVPVFLDEVKVAMTKDFVPVAISGYLTPQLRPLGRFALTAETAAAAAVSVLSGQGVESNMLAPLTYRDGYQFWTFRDEPTPVRARQVWYALPEGLEPGFYVEVELSEGTDSKYHSFVISARTGEVLFEKNLTADASYRVWAEPNGAGIPYDGPNGNVPSPVPSGTPADYRPAFIPAELVSRDFGPISTMDRWLPMNAARTEGNNTFAYADIAAPNGFGTGDIAPTPTSPDTFDRVYNPMVNAESSTEQRAAAVTQLFYDINFFHDWYYDVGFDEMSRNAQTSNYNRGGREGDPINAEGQDNSGRNNANMRTPSDGMRPRMQMYIFDATGNERLSVGMTTITTAGAPFGAQTYNLTAEVVLVNDGSTADMNGGMTGSVSDGCQMNFMNSVAGKIALVDRGNCSFIQKAQIAQANGAAGLIIADNAPGATPPGIGGMPGPGTAPPTIPVTAVTQASGTTLKGMIGGATPPMATLSKTPGISRDGTIDNGIIAHEWGHYISNRLIGDGNGLGSNQSGGMGEGWSDFHALLMMVRAEDLNVPSNANWMGTYSVGGYTSGGRSGSGYYYGVRRVPYSVDPAKNAFTFKHIQEGVALPTAPPTQFGADGAGNAQVHSTGEVWSSMLWECYVALLRDPRHTFAQAQDRMKRYLVGGYKLTPMQPTLVEARDAILAAAAARDPQDFATLWQAFARRGIGMNAKAPDRNSQNNRPVVESFTVGNAVAIGDITIDDSTKSCDNDGILDSDETGVLKITVKNVGAGVLSMAKVNVSTMTPGLTFPSSPTANVPMLQPFASGTVSIPVAFKAAAPGFVAASIKVEVNDPGLAMPGPISTDFRTRLNATPRIDSSTIDDVESPMSKWVTRNDPVLNTASDWRIAQGSATEHFWFGPNPASPADTFLESPALTVGAMPFSFTFRHRWDFEFDAMAFYDGGALEISSDNGATWTDIGASAMPGYNGAFPAQTSNPLRGRRGYVGKSMNYPMFNTETVDLGMRYANQTVKIRFRIGADDAAAGKGWEVDDISFKGITNKPFASIEPDANKCGSGGNRAPTLMAGPDVTVREGEMVKLMATATDPDNDPVTITFTQREGPTVMLTNGTFTAPNVDAETILAFEVVATDGALSSQPARMKVTVVDSASKPIVQAPMRIEVKEGEMASIMATANAAMGRTVTFQWTQESGPMVALDAANTDTVKLTAPMVDADTSLTIAVTASDGMLTSDPVRVEVRVLDVPGMGPTGPTGPTEPMVPGGNKPKPMPKGCGCGTGLDVAAFGLALTAWASRRRRRH